MLKNARGSSLYTPNEVTLLLSTYLALQMIMGEGLNIRRRITEATNLTVTFLERLLRIMSPQENREVPNREALPDSLAVGV